VPSASVLRGGEESRELHPPGRRLQPGCAFVARFPSLIDDETSVRAWGDTLNIARAQNLSAYDAAYLEVATRRGLPIASLDDGLKTAAKIVGVSLFSAS
jgi:hypothetical protein